MNRDEYLIQERNKKIKEFLIDKGGIGYIALVISGIVTILTIVL